MVKSIYVCPAADDAPETGKTRAKIKELIRNGFIVDGYRQIGKTQALLEVIHEDFGGRVVLIVPNAREVYICNYRYRDMFPGEKPPLICLGNREALLWGQDAFYVDGFSRLGENFKDSCYQLPVSVRGIA